MRVWAVFNWPNPMYQELERVLGVSAPWDVLRVEVRIEKRTPLDIRPAREGRQDVNFAQFKPVRIEVEV